MYQLTVETVFCAAHSIAINGVQEPTHGHNWRVRLVVKGLALDSNGLLCDFHLLERELARVVDPFHNHDLNRVPPFDQTNPTAELVAKHIAEAVMLRLPKGVQFHALHLTEAPGCEATWCRD